MLDDISWTTDRIRPLQADELAEEILPGLYTERYTVRVDVGEWQIYIANEVREWLDGLDDATHARVV